MTKTLKIYHIIAYSTWNIICIIFTPDLFIGVLCDNKVNNKTLSIINPFHDSPFQLTQMDKKQEISF